MWQARYLPSLIALFWLLYSLCVYAVFFFMLNLVFVMMVVCSYLQLVTNWFFYNWLQVATIGCMWLHVVTSGYSGFVWLKLVLCG